MGCVRIECSDGRLSRLYSHYPAKVVPVKQLQPRTDSRPVIVYLVTYGGGLVSGDRLSVQCEVQSGAWLLALTQASTKVYRQRAKITPSKEDRECCKQVQWIEDVPVSAAVQQSNLIVASRGLLCWIPEPVTAFQQAHYFQHQRIQIASNACFAEWGSVVVLDWYTSGRASRGETWSFSRLETVNQVYLDSNELFLADRWTMDTTSPHRPVSIQESMSNYHAFATLIAIGPRVQKVVASLRELDESIKLKATTTSSNLLFSTSPLSTADGTVVGVLMRASAHEVWLIRQLLCDKIWNAHTNLLCSSPPLKHTKTSLILASIT